jgi:hypothetical protein
MKIFIICFVLYFVIAGIIFYLLYKREHRDDDFDPDQD